MPSLKVKVMDTVGAGDSFGAAYMVSRLHGYSNRLSHVIARMHSAKVCMV